MASVRKPGVSSPSEIAAFIARAGNNLVIVDARMPDAAAEPSASLGAIAPSPDRPRAINAPIDRTTGTLNLSSIPTAWIDAAGGRAGLFAITHCGGGGRGQKAKEYLLKNGFVEVINGGGPEDSECWAEFCSK